MRKREIVLWILLLISVCINALCLYIASFFFPKAEPLYMPQVEEVFAITLSRNPYSSKQTPLDEKYYEQLLELVADAKGTRRLAVHDFPAGEDYCCFTICTADGKSFYYVYKGKLFTYLYLPYTSVWRVDGDVWDIITENMPAAE